MFILRVIVFLGYMLGTVIKTFKLKYLKKFSSHEKYIEYRDKCVYNWAVFTTKIVGIRLQVYGKENIPYGQNCLYVSNHQSNLDIPCFIAGTKVTAGYIAKKELEGVPVVTTWMRALNSVFMDRKNIRSSLKSIIQGAQNLKNGCNMYIFPEGTRSKSSKIGEFKKGSMKLAVKANAKIIPVTINGTYKAWEGNKNGIIKPADVTMYIHKSIDVSVLSKEEKNNLGETVKSIIETKLDK